MHGHSDNYLYFSWICALPAILFILQYIHFGCNFSLALHFHLSFPSLFFTTFHCREFYNRGDNPCLLVEDFQGIQLLRHRTSHNLSPARYFDSRGSCSQGDTELHQSFRVVGSRRSLHIVTYCAHCTRQSACKYATVYCVRFMRLLSDTRSKSRYWWCWPYCLLLKTSCSGNAALQVSLSFWH